MKVKLYHIGSATFAIVALLCATSAADSDDSDIINPNWIKPGWKNHRHYDPPAPADCPTLPECNCPTLPECPAITEKLPSSQEEYRNAFVHYRKFVRRVFEEQRLEVDPADAGFKVRNIQFRISEPQLKRLMEAKTAGEIDAVLTEIVEQSEGSVYYAIAEGMCRSLFSMYVGAMQNTTFLYWVLPAVAVLVVIVIGKVFNMKLWILIPLLGILITYVLTFRDCNNRLELESLTRLMKIDEGRNPCGKPAPSNWLAKIFHKDTEAECIEHLRNVHGLKRDYCDPSEVFIEMVAKLQMKYFEAFVLNMISIFKSSTATSGWKETLLIWVFVAMFAYLVITRGIKYMSYATGRFLADTATGRGRREGAEAIQGAAQQALPPQLPFNINIVNIPRPRRANSRIEPIPSRIEEIRDAGEQVLPAPAAVGGEIVTTKAVEDGSGDGPVKVAQPVVHQEVVCDAESSSDESIVVIQDQFPDDIQRMINESLANDAREPKLN